MSDTASSQLTITPVSDRVHILFDDAEIVSTLNAVRLEEPGREPRVFVPLDDVHPGILETSETTASDEQRGDAHYYTIKTLTADGPDEAWYYPYADGPYRPIRDLVTFGGDRVQISFTEV